MEPPRYINAEEISSVLTWSMVIDAVEQALIAISNRALPSTIIAKRPHANQSPRSITHTAKKSKILLSMPGYVGNYKLKKYEANINTNAVNEEVEVNANTGIVGVGQFGNCDASDIDTDIDVDAKDYEIDDIDEDYDTSKFTKNHTLACKLVTSYPDNQRYNLPNIMANILLFNNKTGQLKCIMDGTQITAWRTAAASVIATKFLYFRRFGAIGENEIKVNIAIIGCGVQGESHALAMCTTFKVENLYLWNRTGAKAHQLAEKLNNISKTANWRSNTKIHVSEKPADAVSKADIICVGTFSPQPLITYNMVRHKRNLHINAVGAGQVRFGEVSLDLYQKGIVYVDSVESANIELKGLAAKIIGEIGAVIHDSEYITSTTGITIFQSMGVAAEDATVAQAIYNALKAKAVV